MEQITDEEVSNTIKKINSVIKMLNPICHPNGVTTLGHSYRDHLFYKLLNDWNEERKKAGFKPLTTKRLASALNSNYFLKVNKKDSIRDNTSELEYIIKRCEEAGNYKFASFILFPKRKKLNKRQDQ